MFAVDLQSGQLVIEDPESSGGTLVPNVTCSRRPGRRRYAFRSLGNKLHLFPVGETGVAFVADDLAAWLIGLLADAGLKRLTVFVRGTPQERALRSAAAAAIERTALEFVPAGTEGAEELARVVDQVFGTLPGPAVAAGQLTVLEALQAGVADRLAVLGDAGITDTGRSSADVLGVDVTQLTEALTRHLLQEIIYRGAAGGALAPLAGQLNHDVTHLQARQLQGMVGQLLVMVQDALHRLDSAQQAALQAASSGPLDPVFSHYFEPLARGVQRAGIAGWYFTGRESTLREIVTWLTEIGYGALIVTGEPGSGKSAVLARIVTMADARYRATVPPEVLDAAPPGTLPPEGSVDVAIRASALTTLGIAQAIAAKLGLVAAGTDEMIDQVLTRGAMTTVVLDAVDEADDPEELWTELIAPLAQYARTGGIRLLLGVRPKSVRKLQGSRTLNLDSVDYFKEADIAGYVTSYLRGHDRSRFGDLGRDPEAASRLGWRIAQNAGFSFLIAHLTAMSVVESQDDDDPGNFPSTVGEALEQWLHHMAKALKKLGLGDRERTVPGWRLWIHELLTPLAYTEGEGPDDALWASLATMMGINTYSLQDVRLLREKSPAGDLLQGGVTATRLFHAALAEHLREDVSQSDADREISELLIARAGSGVVGGAVDWDVAPAYTRHYLASHAGRAGVLDALMLDVGYLLAADPVRLLAQLPSLTDPKAQQVARVYQLTAHRLRGVNRQSAASALGLTALLSGARWFADAIATVITLTAEPLWAHWQPVSPHRQLVGHKAPVRSVAVCQVGDSLLVVSGAEDGKVLAWDYATTLETEVPDDSLPGPVTAIAAAENMLVAGFQADAATRFCDLRTRQVIGGAHAFQASVGIVDGRPTVAAGDNLIELSNLDTGDYAGGPFDHSEAPLTALGFGKTGAADLLMAACTEAKVHLWEITSNTIAGVIATYQDPVTATAVHEVDGYLTIVAVHSNRVVQSWDVTTGRPVGLPLVGHTGRVLAVTAGEFRGRPYVVTGGEDGTVRVWETSRPYDSSAEQKGMLAVAVGRRGGAVVVITADQARVLQIWSLVSGDEASPPVATTGGAPATLAFGRFGEYDSIAGFADQVGRIHLWDLATAQRVPRRGAANGWSSVLTVGTLDGRLVSATGGIEPRRTVVVYNLETSDQVGVAITLSFAATAAFIGQIGDRRLLATADRTNAVAVWDLDTGRPYGRPIPLSGAAINVVALGNLRTGPVIAAAGPSAPVQVWHLTRDEQITLDLGSTVTGLAFSDDDTMVVTADAGIACVRICGQAS